MLCTREERRMSPTLNLRRGCVLPPRVFSIYIVEVVKKLKGRCATLKNCTKKISEFLLVDGTSLVAD